LSLCPPRPALVAREDGVEAAAWFYPIPGRPWWGGGSCRHVALFFFIQALVLSMPRWASPPACSSAHGGRFECAFWEPTMAVSRGAPLRWLMAASPCHGAGPNGSRAIAPPLLSSVRQNPSALRLQVVRPRGRRCSPAPKLCVLEEEEDWGLDRFPSFPQGPMCLF
jgi:hypothetical protein